MKNTHSSLCLAFPSLLTFCHIETIQISMVEKTYSGEMVSCTCLQDGQGRKRREACLSLGAHCFALLFIGTWNRHRLLDEGER